MSETRDTKTTTKKGNVSWAPAKKLELRGKNPNYNYYWAKATPSNIADKQKEGWEIVTTANDTVAGFKPEGIEMGDSLDTTIRAREMVLMRIPKETAKARTDYWKSQSDQLEETMLEDVKRQMAAKGIEHYTPIKVS